MEIGDGLSKSEETRLTRFIGNILPGDVTSVSNSAWIYIESPPGNISMITEMIIIAVDILGKLHLLKISLCGLLTSYENIESVKVNGIYFLESPLIQYHKTNKYIDNIGETGVI